MRSLLRRFGIAALFALAAILLLPTDAAAHRGRDAKHHDNGVTAAAGAVPPFFLGAASESGAPHCPRGKSAAQHAGCCAHQSCPAGAALAPMPLIMNGAATATPEQGRVPSLQGLAARPGEHPPRR